MQSHMHTMQQTRTYKTVTRGVEAKKLLSRRRQCEYSIVQLIDISRNTTQTVSVLGIYVMRYSKRYLTALPTSYWFGINTFSHKRAAVFSSQEVHDIIGCKL